MNNLTHTAAVILAAGKGTRIGSHLPKVLYPLAGRPMVRYILDTFSSVGIKDIYVVTGFRSEDVQASISRRAFFVHQPNPLGTGHAVSCALNEIPPDVDTVIVVNGDDSSFYSTDTINNTLIEHNKIGGVISLVTTVVDNPAGFGRIIRDNDGKVLDIREEKEATDTEKSIKEVNIGFYIFNVDWIRNVLPKIVPQSNSEIYLTDVLSIAKNENKLINSINLINPAEWQGVNTQEQLALANAKMVDKIKSETSSKKVFLFDLDDTLLATIDLKKIIEKKVLYVLKNVFSITLLDNEIKSIFWETYSKHKQANGWVSMPELGEELAKVFGVESGGPTFKRLFYTLPFEQYIKTGVCEMLTDLRSSGMRVILAYGDLVYQPIKLSIFNNYTDSYQTYEKLTDSTISEIVNIYENSKIFITDDRLKNLANFKKVNQSIKTIWFKDGPYKNDLVDGFKSDYEVQNIAELKELLSNI